MTNPGELIRQWRRRRSYLATAHRYDIREPVQARLRLPADERIQIRIVSVSEVFGPSQSAQLESGLRALGVQGSTLLRRDITATVDRHRRADQLLGPQDLGFIVPRGSGAIAFSGTVEADLPPGVESASLSLTALGGSMTVLTVTFGVDAGRARWIDDALRRTHLTTPVPGQGAGYWPPDWTQVEVARRERARAHAVLADWVTTWVPGVFATLGQALPAAVLQTHRTSRAEHNWEPEATWPRALQLRSSRRRRSTTFPALFMSTDHHDAREENLLLLTARESALLVRVREGGVRMKEDEAWQHLTNRLARTLDGTMALWAALCLMDAYGTRLATFRDTLSPTGVRARTASQRLSTIAAQSRELADMQAILADIGRWSGQSWTFKNYDGNDWRSPTDGANGWVDSNVGFAAQRARELAERERALRDRLQLEIDLLAGGAGLRVQRLGLSVAMIAMVVAAAALVQTASHTRNTSTTTHSQPTSVPQLSRP